MAKSGIVFLALSALTVHSAVLKGEDTVLKRIARSPCDECGGPPGPPPPPPPFGPPPPPPPPPRFRSQNWSGYTRSADGASQGVFSGAAAAADLGTQTGSQAFSIASASGNAGAQSANAGAEGYRGSAGNSRGFGSGAGTKGFGADNGQTQTNGFNEGNSQSSNYKESHYSSHSGGKHFDQGDKTKFSAQRGDIDGLGGSNAQSGSYASSGASANQGFSGNEQQRQQLGSSFNGNGGSQSQSEAFSSQGHGFSGNQQQHANLEQGFSGQQQHGNQRQGYSGNGQQQQTSFNKENYASGSSSNAQSGAFSGQGNKHGHQDEFSGNQQQVQSSWQKDFGSGSASRQGGTSPGASRSTSFDDGQSALNGALNLASQGLQQQSGEGCRTCGKSSYALSNAKSHSGNAIALSIGG